MDSARRTGQGIKSFLRNQRIPSATVTGRPSQRTYSETKTTVALKRFRVPPDPDRIQSPHACERVECRTTRQSASGLFVSCLVAPMVMELERGGDVTEVDEESNAYASRAARGSPVSHAARAAA